MHAFLPAFPALRRLAVPALLAAGALFPGCSAPAPESDAAAPAEATAAASTPRLLVGSDLDNKPFAWVDQQGRAQGRDVEMMTALAQLLHRKLEWQRIPFDQLLPAVEAGEVDVVCATLGVTPERQARVDFSIPYFQTVIVAVVRVGEHEPRTLGDLSGKRVAVGVGTTSERAVRNQLPNAVGVFENKAGLPAAQRLLSLEVDAVVMDGPAADTLVAASGGRLIRLAEPLATESYALALPKHHEALREELDRGLAAFQRAGSMGRWNEKHGLALGSAPEPAPVR